jgi:hypothetical protein
MSKTILKVNGEYIQDPSSLEYQRYDLDSEDGSGRNQKGLMFRDRVAVKVKLVCKFPPLHWDEVSELLHAVNGQFFTLEYPDAYEGTTKEITAYVGDRTAPMYTVKPNGDILWEGLSMNFIER